MLPFVLVSLFVSIGVSALAVPAVQVSQYNINELAPVRDNGKLVSSFLTDRSFETVDGGDTNIYILTIQQIINDLANQPDARSQALAVGQTISVLGELATGIPGDACDAATLVNAVASGNPGAIRSALKRYLGRLASSIDYIAQLAVNPNSLRNASGPKGNCAGAGRSYQFEAAWDVILANSNAYQIGLVNEEYCAAKRLYSAFNARSNNVGAAVTAASVAPVNRAVRQALNPLANNVGAAVTDASVAPVNRAVRQALNPLANFLRVVASGGNPSAAAAKAKSALLQAGANVQL